MKRLVSNPPITLFAAATLSLLAALMPTPAWSAPPTLDAAFAEVARRAPGFGGAYFDQGTLRVHVVPDGKTVSDTACNRALEALGGVVGRDRLLQPLGDPRHIGGRQPWSPVKPVCVAGAYDFATLADWKQRARAVFKVAGVSALDIDESRNRLVVVVNNLKKLTDPVYRALAAVGVPDSAVVLEETALQTRYMLSGSLAATEHFPVFGGIEIMKNFPKAWLS